MVRHELWPYISYIILRAVETYYMQNDRADPNFQGRWISFLRTHRNKITDIKHPQFTNPTFFWGTLYINVTLTHCTTLAYELWSIYVWSGWSSCFGLIWFDILYRNTESLEHNCNFWAQNLHNFCNSCAKKSDCSKSEVSGPTNGWILAWWEFLSPGVKWQHFWNFWVHKLLKS